MTDEQTGHMGNVMFDLAPSLRVNVWLTGDVKADTDSLTDAMLAIRGWLAHDAKTRVMLGILTDEERAALPAPQQRTQEQRRAPAQQRRGGGQRRGQGQSRADKYERYEGETCDVCGGPVGIYPRRGNMQSDKLVCLGRCKDDDYVHTVMWLDE